MKKFIALFFISLFFHTMQGMESGLRHKCARRTVHSILAEITQELEPSWTKELRVFPAPKTDLALIPTYYFPGLLNQEECNKVIINRLKWIYTDDNQFKYSLGSIFWGATRESYMRAKPIVCDGMSENENSRFTEIMRLLVNNVIIDAANNYHFEHALPLAVNLTKLLQPYLPEDEEEIAQTISLGHENRYVVTIDEKVQNENEREKIHEIATVMTSLVNNVRIDDDNHYNFDQALPQAIHLAQLLQPYLESDLSEITQKTYKRLCAPVHQVSWLMSPSKTWRALCDKKNSVAVKLKVVTPYCIASLSLGVGVYYLLKNTKLLSLIGSMHYSKQLKI